jgi:predicted negative regulator of RcsB-dependent stress response
MNALGAAVDAPRGKEKERMAAYDLEEQEQIANLKAWWNQYGNLVAIALLLAALIVAGWSGWRWYRASQSGDAAAAYAELLKAVRANDTKKVGDTAGLLTAKFGGTNYAALGALLSAKQYYLAGDAKTAKVQLEWVATKARDPELATIARLRLANVLLDEKAYDEALKQLDAPREAAFDGLVAATRGDVLAAKGAKADARAAYTTALEKLDKNDAAMRQQVQLRLDALGAS